MIWDIPAFVFSVLFALRLAQGLELVETVVIQTHLERFRVDNPSNAQLNSTSPCTSDFTGRVSIL